MAAEYIHVKIGLTDAVYPVLELITTGPFNGFYHYSTSPTTTAWTHKRWCTPCAADGTPHLRSASFNGSVPCHSLQAVDSTTTDWRAFLKTHRDTERNHCKVEHLDEFYRIFRRAAAAYIQKHEQDNKQQDYKEVHLQLGGYEPRRANEVLYPSVRQRPVPYMPTDKNSVRKTGKQMKQVPYATAEQQPQPKRKPRYVELSLFD